MSCSCDKCLLSLAQGTEILQHLPSDRSSSHCGILCHFSVEKAELAPRCSSSCIQFIHKSRENSLVYLFNLFDKALWITVLCQSVSVFQNPWLFKSQTGFSTKQIFSQVTKMDENWLLQEQLLFLSFYRWSLEGPQSPAVWNTETKEEAMDLWSKAGVRHHTKQLQGANINFILCPFPGQPQSSLWAQISVKATKCVYGDILPSSFTDIPITTPVIAWDGYGAVSWAELKIHFFLETPCSRLCSTQGWLWTAPWTENYDVQTNVHVDF